MELLLFQKKLKSIILRKFTGILLLNYKIVKQRYILIKKLQKSNVYKHCKHS